MKSTKALSTLALLPMLGMALQGCGGKPSASQSTGASPQDPAEQSRVTNMHMHFDDINAILLALISGNLVSARTLATKVRHGFSGEQPVGWKPFIERTIASAEILEVTDDLAIAAGIAATMAGTCGDCHVAENAAVINQTAMPPPHEEDPFSDFMTQHRWGADRMWEGIIGPSDEAWRAGAKALATTDLSADDVGEHLIMTPEIEALLVQVRRDSAAAPTTEGAENRQKLYGSFLAGCASCHRDMMNQRD